jgi:hypothetical protein
MAEKNNKAALAGLGLSEKTWDAPDWLDLIQRLYVKAQKDVAEAASEKQREHVFFHAAQAAAYAEILMNHYLEKEGYSELAKQWRERYMLNLQRALTRKQNRIALKLGSQML